MFCHRCQVFFVKYLLLDMIKKYYLPVRVAGELADWVMLLDNSHKFTRLADLQ